MDQSRKGTKAFGDSRLALTPEFNTFSLHHQPSGKEDNGRRNENGSAYAYYIDLMNSELLRLTRFRKSTI